MKTKYDPRNFFRVNQNIPPTADEFIDVMGICKSLQTSKGFELFRNARAIDKALKCLPTPVVTFD